MPSPSDVLPAVLQKIDDGLDRSLERLFEFLRIQSISTDPAYKEQCRAAAEHVAKDLADIGFATTVRPTEGHPIVVAKGGSDANGKVPRVLFYGHYDVQPVDPLDLWDAPPFAPRLRNCAFTAGCASRASFGASASVLVVEVVALRLLAPYLGLTLETSTIVIGLALAAITYIPAITLWLPGFSLFN